MGQLMFSSLEIERWARRRCWRGGGWRLTMPDGARPGGFVHLISASFPQGWKIVHDHTSAEEPAPPKPAGEKTTSP